ncbi:MAG: Uma2 family endonuclease [Saprospiraceae bacterium]|nr:Uma2 family endonuclease [Saprospiraceae bacterium]
MVRLPEATIEHGRLISNSNAAISHALRKKRKKCWASAGSQKVFFEDFGDGGIPDVLVVCGKPVFKPLSNDVIINPTLVVEVLSPSTEDYDRGGKFARYRSLASFQEYVLISQDACKVEVWFRLEENVWRISRFEGLEAVMKLDSIGLEIPLSELYAGMEELAIKQTKKPSKQRRKAQDN